MQNLQTQELPNVNSFPSGIKSFFANWHDDSHNVPSYRYQHIVISAKFTPSFALNSLISFSSLLNQWVRAWHVSSCWAPISQYQSSLDPFHTNLFQNDVFSVTHFCLLKTLSLSSVHTTYFTAFFLSLLKCLKMLNGCVVYQTQKTVFDRISRQMSVKNNMNRRVFLITIEVFEDVVKLIYIFSIIKTIKQRRKQRNIIERNLH